MGQKVHPIGLRLGRNRKWNSTWFLSNQDYTKFLHLSFSLEKFLEGVLHYSPRKALLVNFKIINYSLEKLYIFVFFYRYRRKTKINYNINLNDNKLFKPKIKKQSTLEKQYNEYIYNQVINNVDSLNNNKIFNVSIKNLDKNLTLHEEFVILNNYLNNLNKNIVNSIDILKQIKLKKSNLNKTQLDILNIKKIIKKCLVDLISYNYQLVILKSILKIKLKENINNKSLYSEVLFINKKIKTLKSKKKIISNIIELNVNLINLELSNLKLNNFIINTKETELKKNFFKQTDALNLIKKIDNYLKSVTNELKVSRQNKKKFIKLNGIKQVLLDNKLQLLNYLNNRTVYKNYLISEKDKIFFNNLLAKTNLTLKLFNLNTELLKFNNIENNSIKLHNEKSIIKQKVQYLTFLKLFNKNNKINYLKMDFGLDQSKINSFFKLFLEKNTMSLNDLLKSKNLNLRKLFNKNIDLNHLVKTKEFKLKNQNNLNQSQKNFVNIFLNKKQLNFKGYITKNFVVNKKN